MRTIAQLAGAATEEGMSRRQWIRLVAGLAAVFTLFQSVAMGLGSDRGQGGILVAAVVVAATLLVERTLFGGGLRSAVRTLGLGTPRFRGVAAASAVSASLMMATALVVRASGGIVSIDPDAGWMLPGLFAQAGTTFPLVWMAACAVLPPAVLLLRTDCSPSRWCRPRGLHVGAEGPQARREG